MSRSQDKGFEKRIRQCLEANHGCHVTKLRSLPPVTRTDEAGNTSQFAVDGTYDFSVLLRVPGTYYYLPYALELKTAQRQACRCS